MSERARDAQKMLAESNRLANEYGVGFTRQDVAAIRKAIIPDFEDCDDCSTMDSIAAKMEALLPPENP